MSKACLGDGACRVTRSAATNRRSMVAALKLCLNPRGASPIHWPAGECKAVCREGWRTGSARQPRMRRSNPPPTFQPVARPARPVNCASRGILVSPSGVRSIWLRHDLANFKTRLEALEAQVQALERKKLDDEARGETEAAHLFPARRIANSLRRLWRPGRAGQVPCRHA